MIAIGDSITEGYLDGDCWQPRDWHPFTNRLELLVNGSHRDITIQESGPFTEFVTGTVCRTNAIEIKNHGRSGERTREIKDRLKFVLSREKKHHFKYATLLSGLNDIGEIHDLQELGQLVVDDIKQMCSMLRKHGCKFIFLMTLPICPLDLELEWYRNIKKWLNARIRKECGKMDGVVLVDLARNSTMIATKENQKQLFWDHLHYTPQGYDLLADILFSHFVAVSREK